VYWEAAYGRAQTGAHLAWADEHIPADCAAHPLVDAARQAAVVRVSQQAQDAMAEAMAEYQEKHPPIETPPKKNSRKAAAAPEGES
jgi:hypothetical protein